MIPSANPAGCYLMQLTMRKFDVKKNCLTTKDFVGVDYKNFNFISPWFCSLKNSDFQKKHFIIL